MALGIEVVLSNIQGLLETLAPTISVILIILSGIVYGLSFTQTPENRGKWQTIAIGLFVGGVVVAAISFAATRIKETSSTLLT